MCGIAGIKARFVSRNIVLTKMISSNCMLLRGPDSHGEYFDDEIALGIRRLKIIDLTDQGNQPMSNEKDNIWIVFNGEIYNFKELRQELERLGHRFKSQTDTEVILHSYEEWGNECLSKLRGMFAFGIWDKHKKELFLARDRLGIKPLYYYYKDGIFMFASQVRAILESGIVPKRISPQGIFAYLDSGGVKEPETLIEGIYSLEPAHCIVLSEAGFKVVKYWDPLRIPVNNSYSTTEEITERINFLLKEAIQLHLISDVPLGIFLSGGVDSGSLLNLATKISSEIRTVSLIFKEEPFNEAFYSRTLANKYRSRHKEILIEEKDFLKNYPNAILAMDQPTFNGINTYFISQAAKDAGLTVVLSGLGGDEVFCGYNTFRRIPILMKFCKLWNKTPRLLREACADVLKRIILPFPQKDKLMELVKDNSSLEHSYSCLRQLFTDEQKEHLLKTWIVSRRKEIEGLQNLDIVNQVSYLEISNYMRDILLRDSDFMSMDNSLELRVPLLDHKLLEFMFSVPGKFKMARTLNKPLLVNSLDEPLPEVVTRRNKRGFVLPFEHWIRMNLKKEVEQTLQEEDGALGEFFNSEGILDIWSGYLNGYISWQRPWSLYVLKKWIKVYLQ